MEFDSEVGAVLTPAVVDFVSSLVAKFASKRTDLLVAREERNQAANGTSTLDFLDREESPIAAASADPNWTIRAEIPNDLKTRYVDIMMPLNRPKVRSKDEQVSAKLPPISHGADFIERCLESKADGIQADLDDAHCPSWRNNIEAQSILRDIVHGKLGTSKQRPALIMRPRSLNLDEPNFTSTERSNEQSVSTLVTPGALFDFGVFMAHNAKKLLESESGPYFYLPKLEHFVEAQFWAEVFEFAESYLSLPSRSIKCIVLIENIHAAFQMDEILFVLRDYCIGLNSGKFDYVFSYIKAFCHDPAKVLPERSKITGDLTFLKTANDLLIQTCHRRGAFATTGMAPYLSWSDDAEAQVRSSKASEARSGSDGALVACPELVGGAREAFSEHHSAGLEYRQRLNLKCDKETTRLLTEVPPTNTVSHEGLKEAVEVVLLYIDAWLRQEGTVNRDGKVEDIATAEICRSLVWQWLRHKVKVCADDPDNEQSAAVISLDTVTDIVKTVEASTGVSARASELALEVFGSDTFVPFLSNFLIEKMTW